MSNISVDSVNISRARRAVAILPSSVRTTAQNTNSPSFHIIKLPAPDGTVDRLQRVVAEFCIQPLGTVERQAIWWTSYVVIAQRGTLTRGSGVYVEWAEFGSFATPQMGVTANVTPRTSDIVIADTSKGVLNGPNTNGTVLRVVELNETPSNVDVFAVLVATGMHDGAYQVLGQARVEFRSQ